MDVARLRTLVDRIVLTHLDILWVFDVREVIADMRKESFWEHNEANSNDHWPYRISSRTFKQSFSEPKPKRRICDTETSPYCNLSGGSRVRGRMDVPVDYSG